MLNRKAKRRMNEHPLIKILNKHPEYTRLVDALKRARAAQPCSDWARPCARTLRRACFAIRAKPC